MTDGQKSSFKNKEDRINAGHNIIQLKQILDKCGSERRAIEILGVPRSTCRHWVSRQNKCNLDNLVVEFFNTLEGIDFLHRLTLAIEFVLPQLCNAGTGIVKKLYELSGLDQLVACSTGTLHKRTTTMEKNLVRFGQEQLDKLSQNMPAKDVTCAVDETFPPGGICLVGIEVESNFILLEQFADKRDCDTWDQAMKEPLSSLPIKVVQVVSDQAKALLKYTKQRLDAHHSPDIFHILQEIIKGTTAPLVRAIKAENNALKEANELLQYWINLKISSDKSSVKQLGRPVDYDQHINTWSEIQKIAIDNAVTACTRREEVKSANRSISQDYHPIDLETGKKRTPKMFEKQANNHFSVIETHAVQAGLSENSIDRIHKAQAMLGSLVLTLEFFWSSVGTEIKKLGLSPPVASFFKEFLLPMAYMEVHIPKIKIAKLKYAQRNVYQQLAQKLNANPTWLSQTPEQRDKLRSDAKRCAQFFQRSSSCVEGRNGQLSLKHHASRKISPRKLASSTVIHNYFIKRSDGTTAAQRLFEQVPDDLFEWLLNNTDCPPFPAQKRPAMTKLQAAA